MIQRLLADGRAIWLSRLFASGLNKMLFACQLHSFTYILPFYELSNNIFLSDRLNTKQGYFFYCNNILFSQQARTGLRLLVCSPTHWVFASLVSHEMRLYFPFTQGKSKSLLEPFRTFANLWNCVKSIKSIMKIRRYEFEYFPFDCKEQASSIEICFFQCHLGRRYILFFSRSSSYTLILKLQRF